MKIYILILMLFLVGCEKYSALYSYTCTKDQMSKVQEETLWCKQNTKYYDTFCYSTAIERNCEEKKK